MSNIKKWVCRRNAERYGDMGEGILPEVLYFEGTEEQADILDRTLSISRWAGCDYLWYSEEVKGNE